MVKALEERAAYLAEELQAKAAELDQSEVSLQAAFSTLFSAQAFDLQVLVRRNYLPGSFLSSHVFFNLLNGGRTQCRV